MVGKAPPRCPETPVTRLRYAFLPSIACLIWLLQFLRNTVTPMASGILSFDGDIALHVKLGDLMRAYGGWLPTEPTNTLSGDTPFIAHEWLPEVVLSFAYDALGWAGPVWLTALLLATLSAGMYRRMLADGTGPWPALITLISAITVMNGHLHPRPHVLTWCFGFLMVVWLEAFRTGRLSFRPWLARSAALVLLWAQCHGGFLVIFPMLLAYLAGAGVHALTSDTPAPHLQRAKQLALGALVLLGVSAINPWGFALHEHFLAWMANPYMMSFTTEFQSPDFKGSAGRFLLGFLILSWFGLALPRQRPAPGPFFLWLGLTIMALSSARHAALLAVFTTPWVAHRLHLGLQGAVQGSWIQPALDGLKASNQRLRDGEQQLGGWVTAGLVALGVTWALATGAAPVAMVPAMQPVSAAEWVAEHPDEVGDRLFNPFRWGAYLAWRLYPEHQVHMNSWHDHLGEAALRDYFAVHEVTPRWQDVLDAHGVDWILYNSGTRLAYTLNASDDWEVVYNDSTATIWRKRSQTVQE